MQPLCRSTCVVMGQGSADVAAYLAVFVEQMKASGFAGLGAARVFSKISTLLF